jgi:hypothetical protein
VAPERRCSAPTGLRRPWARPAKIYYKYEGVSPAGSHKPNTAVPQAWYNAQAGIKKRLTTETGAGQWGTRWPLPARCSARRAGVPGARELRPEALPPRADGNLRRHAAWPAPATKRTRPRVLAERPDHPGSWASPSARRWRWPPARRHQVRAGLGAQPRAAAPDHHRPGGHAAAGNGRRRPRRGRRLHRRRQQLRGHRLPLHRPAAARRQESAASWRWSPPPAPA